MCPFGLSDSKRAHLRAPALHHPERDKKSENGRAGEGKKTRNFWSPALGPPPIEPTLRAPPLLAPPFGPPSLRAEALRASTFSGFGPLRSSFLSCSSFVVIFFFFENFTVFVFVVFGRGKPKPQTSFQFGEEEGGSLPPQTQTPFSLLPP